MSAPSSTGRGPGSSELVRLVAGREISARLRDKNFISVRASPSCC